MGTNNNKTKVRFVNIQILEDRINEVLNVNLLDGDDYEDILVQVEEDLVLEKADEIRRKRARLARPSFNGVF